MMRLVVRNIMIIAITLPVVESLSKKVAFVSTYHNFDVVRKVAGIRYKCDALTCSPQSAHFSRTQLCMSSTTIVPNVAKTDDDYFHNKTSGTSTNDSTNYENDEVAIKDTGVLEQQSSNNGVKEKRGSKKNRVLLQLNQELNELAEKAGAWNVSSVASIAAASQAEALWKEKCQNSPEDTDIISFNTVLKAWSKCCHKLADHKHNNNNKIINDGAASTGSSFFDQTIRVLDLSSSSAASSNTNDQLISTKFNVYTATDAALHAERLLLREIKKACKQDRNEEADDSGTHNTNQQVLRPDTHSFNSVMNAWASCGDTGLEHVEALFAQMKDPRKGTISTTDTSPSCDTVSYNALVDAIVNSKVPNRLDRLYDLWNEEFKSSLSNNGYEHKHIRPTVRTLNSILLAFSRPTYSELSSMQSTSFSSDSSMAYQHARRANKILDDMKEHFQRTKDVDDHPDAVSYTAVMECWSRCNSYEGAKNAEKLLEELKQEYNEKSDLCNTEGIRLQPSAYTYTAIIKAWARAAPTSDSTAPRRAMEVLEELIQVSEAHQQHTANNQQTHNHHSNGSNPIQPNSVPFTSVLQCWAQSKHVPNRETKALELLKRMKNLVATTGNPSLNPTIATYNSAIDVCARCGDSVAGVKNDAVELSKHQLAALQIAFAILKAMEVDAKHSTAPGLSTQPSHVTYGKLLKAVGALLPPGVERNRVAKAVFQKAIDAGQVDVSVVRNLQKAADVVVLQEFFPNVLANTQINNSPTSPDGAADHNGHDKVESLILQRNKGVALNTHMRRNAASSHGGKSFISSNDIPHEWSKNVLLVNIAY